MDTTNTASRFETKTYYSTVRYNGKCRTCRKAYSRTTERTVVVTRRTDIIARSDRRVNETTLHAIDCCGRHVALFEVKGIKRADIKCGAKCTGATGHVCECECGGRNHGAGHD
jgi:hypothetical protein